VISNPAVSTTTGWPVGFWWSELTHPYFQFTEVGYEAEMFSPNGGRCEADAMSSPEDASGWQADDVIGRGYVHDPEFIKLVENTRSIDELDVDAFDAIVIVGGQGPMFHLRHGPYGSRQPVASVTHRVTRKTRAPPGPASNRPRPEGRVGPSARRSNRRARWTSVESPWSCP
jgi:putative intracellular protease/amidase